MTDNSNPFAGLITVTDRPADIAEGNDSLQVNSKNPQEDEEAETINNIVENVFHFTINSRVTDVQPGDKQLVYLEELAECMKPTVLIDLETLEQALFERLLLTDIETAVLPKNTKVYKEHVVQKLVFPYLFSSLQNLQSYDNSSVATVQSAVKKMRELIFRNAVTALKQPALFEGQDFSVQLLELLQHVDPQSHTFFVDLVRAFVTDGKNCILFTS